MRIDHHGWTANDNVKSSETEALSDALRSVQHTRCSFTLRILIGNQLFDFGRNERILVLLILC